MESPKLLICSREDAVLSRLSELFHHKKELGFEIFTYRDAAEAAGYAKATHIALLIIGEAELAEMPKEVDADCVVVLRTSDELATEHSTVYLLQPAGEILKEICRIYAECQEAEGKRTATGRKAQIIGFYSPIGGAGQTSAALTLGEMMAPTGRVLYLNLEKYPGLRDLPGGEGTLTDLLYFSGCNPAKLAYRMESIVRHLDGLDVVLPDMAPGEYEEIPAAEWKALWDTLAEQCAYQTIIVDLSDRIRNLPEVLKLCNRVISVMRIDESGKAKWAAFEEVMKTLGEERLCERMERWVLPQISGQAEHDRIRSRAYREAIREAWDTEPEAAERTRCEVGMLTDSEEHLTASGGIYDR